jgi:D-aminoacyl-tRNA deacylase
MSLTNLLVVSREDTASCNIQKYLLEFGDWKEHEIYDGNQTFISGNTIMVTIETIHLYYDNIDKKVESELGIKPELVVFASRHRSESGLKTLTVHPLGNFTEAKFGGIPGKLVPADAKKMAHALRTLIQEGTALEHKISFEATHHGPYLETPTFFIEIGSDENAWVEDPPAKVLARTILKIMNDLVSTEDRIAVGVGGGHYVPRLTEVVLGFNVAFGHMVPTYAADMPYEMFQKAIEGTPGADCVYFHRKYMKKSRYREIKTWFENETSLEVVDSKSLKPIETI